MESKYLIVGAGWSGATIARKLAEDGKIVVVKDLYNHVAGHSHDEYFEDTGTLVHMFGPHIFHTNNEEVFNFVTQFGEFYQEQPVVSVYIKETKKVYKTPFNFELIDDLYDKNESELLKEALKKDFPGRERVTVVELINSNNQIIKDYGNKLFDIDYKWYTAKQWGRNPKDIDPSVLKRVPVFIGYQEGYFSDKYIGFFKEGYTALITKMLDHKNIELQLGHKVDLSEIENYQRHGFKVIYTGSLDELLDNKFGHLPYRTLKMTYQIVDRDLFKGHSVIAFPRDKTVTRITQANMLPRQNNSSKRVLVIEEPMEHVPGKTDAYYPINNKKNDVIHNQYKEKAKQLGIYFTGRLANYKYYNMDQVVEEAIRYYEEEIK